MDTQHLLYAACPRYGSLKSVARRGKFMELLSVVLAHLRTAPPCVVRVLVKKKGWKAATSSMAGRSGVDSVTRCSPVRR